MIKQTIEIYSDIVDNAVVRMPERKVLGSVMQGDTLFLLHSDLMDLLECHKHEPESELFYRLFQIAKRTELRLLHYINVCKDHDIEISFDIDFSVEDYEPLF